MNSWTPQRIFSVLIVLALIAGTPVRIAFSGSTGSLASICAGAEVSAKGCCNECGDKGLSIDVCAPQCVVLLASLLIAVEMPRPGLATAEPAPEIRETGWRTKPDPLPPKLSRHV